MVQIDERGSDSGVSAAGAERFAVAGTGQSIAAGGGQYTATVEIIPDRLTELTFLDLQVR